MPLWAFYFDHWTAYPARKNGCKFKLRIQEVEAVPLSGETMLYCGDCLEIMQKIPLGSVDLVLCDLPYGTMKGAGLDGWNKQTTAWDEKINTAKLYESYERILRESGTAILFSQEPYTSELRTSKTLNFVFAYPMVWKKDHFANALIAKKAPVSYFEDLSVFYKQYDRQLANPLRDYAQRVLNYIGKPKKEVVKEVGQRVDHFFRTESMQFALCTESTYSELVDRFCIDQMDEYMTFSECEEIYKKYRRTFNLPTGCAFAGNVL
jgi:site-specific DNA-methyltransferase (adenine-specific)